MANNAKRPALRESGDADDPPSGRLIYANLARVLRLLEESAEPLRWNAIVPPISQKHGESPNSITTALRRGVGMGYIEVSDKEYTATPDGHRALAQYQEALRKDIMLQTPAPILPAPTPAPALSPVIPPPPEPVLPPPSIPPAPVIQPPPIPPAPNIQPDPAFTLPESLDDVLERLSAPPRPNVPDTARRIYLAILERLPADVQDGLAPVTQVVTS